MSATTESDAQLLARVAKGEAPALARLHDRLAPTVLGLARRMVGSGPEADEVCLEVFTQVWRQAARYEASRGSVHAWVMVMARTRALDLLRERQRQAQRWVPYEQEAPADAAWTDPVDEALATERRHLVVQALGGLVPEQRRALELAYFEGLTQVEIAQATGWPLGTVKTRIRSALLRLREGATLREVLP